MQNLLLFTLFVLIQFSGYSQKSFEGNLLYTVSFTVNFKSDKISQEDIIERLKDQGEFYDTLEIFIKGNNYLKRINASSEKTVIYRGEENNIYISENNDDQIIKLDASSSALIQLDFGEREIEITENVKEILGENCHLVQFDWPKFGTESYYYSDSLLSIAPQHFINHQFDGLSDVLAITKAYPLEIVKTLGQNIISITMTLASFEETAIDENLFILPEMKLNKKMTKTMQKMNPNVEVFNVK